MHFCFLCFYLVSFHEHSRFTGEQGKGEVITLIPLCHFHPLHRQLDNSRAITTEPLVSERKSSTTKLRAITPFIVVFRLLKYEDTVTKCVILFLSSGVLILILKNKKKTVFFNVLISPILSSIIKYCEIEKPENTN